MGTVYVYKNEYGEIGRKNQQLKKKFVLKAVAEQSYVPNEMKVGGQRVNIGSLAILRRSTQKINGARFGAALVNLGRLDADKFEDFAVGSPYEDDGNGAVYIYRGSYDFWSTKENGKNGK